MENGKDPVSKFSYLTSLKFFFFSLFLGGRRWARKISKRLEKDATWTSDSDLVQSWNHENYLAQKFQLSPRPQQFCFIFFFCIYFCFFFRFLSGERCEMSFRLKLFVIMHLYKMFFLLLYLFICRWLLFTCRLCRALIYALCKRFSKSGHEYHLSWQQAGLTLQIDWWENLDSGPSQIGLEFLEKY